MRLLKKKSWDESGVSEVVGTILILGMTVVLFSAVLLWIYAIPTPTPDLKVDIQGTLQPIYKSDGTWNGVNITLRHNGGEELTYRATLIYLNIQRGSTKLYDSLKTRGIMKLPPDNGKPYGLIDGADNNWGVGERWSYTNHSIQENDRIEVLIIDTDKSVLLWQRTLQGLAGLNPPIFIDKWADKEPGTPTRDTPKTGAQFYLFANVIDPDGDLNKNSVYVIVTGFYGSKDFRENPQKMRDDGAGGDQVANDGVFTFTASWLIPGNISWDGSVVIFNATDMAGHKTTSRMTLSVLQGSTSSTLPPRQRPKSGAPPNLKYNGLQGFNIFNATEWDYNPYGCNETRTFKEGETVVVVIASALLKNAKGAHNEFYLYDPFSNLPPEPVVYGTDKTPTPDTEASNTLAFTFFEYINGYNVFTYRFDLNNASSVGINYYTNPTHPPYYFFGRYSLEMTIWDDVVPQPTKFHTTDTINITDVNGNMRQYPKLETFKNSAYTQKSNTFNNSDIVWVRVTMRTVDSSYYMGMVAVQDFLGGTQIWRAPLSGKLVNQPICPVTQACTTGNTAVEMHGTSVSYRFSLNLSMANQDAWVPGTQNYALRILSIRDIDEEYTLALQSQLTITAPDFLLDVAIALEDTNNPAWGTHDFGYYFEDLNGADKWSNPAIRIFSTETKQSGFGGRALRYLDFDLDGDLDIAASFQLSNQDSYLYLFRRDLDTSGNTIWTPFVIESTGNNPVTAVTTGSLDRDTAAEIVIGKNNGAVGYYKNDGSWTYVTIDTRTAKINSIDIGDFDGDDDNDVAVAINTNSNQVYWYPNLDGNGKFTTTQTTTHCTATQESTVLGTVVSGNYSSTQTDDTERERLREERRTFQPTYINNTASAEATFTYGSISGGSYLDTQQNNNVYESLVEGPSTGSRQELQAYWPISVPSGDSYIIKVKGHKSSGSSPNEDFRFQWATSTGGPWTNMFTITSTSDAWHAYGGGTNLSLSGYNTVYVRVVDSAQSSGESADTVYVDYLYLETYIGSRDTSALEHYWKLATLPTGPSSTYTLRIRGYRPNNADSDNFLFSYSTTGQYGSYSATITINSATETTYTYNLPNIGGSTVWIRVTDTNRANNQINLDDIYVNLLEITVDTPGGITGYAIDLVNGDAATALDAGNQNGDAYDDLAVGTSSNGYTYKVMGSSGGLVSPSNVFASPGGSISGVKLADSFPSRQGLEIIVSTGANVYIYQANGATGTLLKTLTTPGSESIKALAAGDVDADGFEDVVVTTGGTNIGRIVYFKNALGNWYTPTIPQFVIGVPIWCLDLGDASNAIHRGR